MPCGVHLRNPRRLNRLDGVKLGLPAFHAHRAMLLYLKSDFRPSTEAEGRAGIPYPAAVTSRTIRPPRKRTEGAANVDLKGNVALVINAGDLQDYRRRPDEGIHDSDVAAIPAA